MGEYGNSVELLEIDGLRSEIERLTSENSALRACLATRENECNWLKKNLDEARAALRGTLTVIDELAARSPAEMQHGFAMWREPIVHALGDH